MLSSTNILIELFNLVGFILSDGHGMNKFCNYNYRNWSWERLYEIAVFFLLNLNVEGCWYNIRPFYCKENVGLNVDFLRSVFAELHIFLLCVFRLFLKKLKKIDNFLCLLTHSDKTAYDWKKKEWQKVSFCWMVWWLCWSNRSVLFILKTACTWPNLLFSLHAPSIVCIVWTKLNRIIQLRLRQKFKWNLGPQLILRIPKFEMRTNLFVNNPMLLYSTHFNPKWSIKSTSLVSYSRCLVHWNIFQ